MKAEAVFLLLLVVSVAAEYGWRPKQDYKFALEGRTLAGLPNLKHQYSGIHFMGSLRVQTPGTQVLLMKLQNMTYSKLHTHLPRGWWQNLPESEVAYQELPISNSPFYVRLEDGMISRMVMSEKMPAWEKNFIQAIVSQFQLDLSGTHSVGHSNSNMAPGRSDGDLEVFSVMENSVVGRCEVLYEVSPIPRHTVKSHPDLIPSVDMCGSRSFLEVTKTRNYSNCERSDESHFGLPASMSCSPGGSQCGYFWNRASVTRSLVCGDRKDYIYLSSLSSSKVVAALRMKPGEGSEEQPDSQASVGTLVNIVLISRSSLGKSLGQPIDPIYIDGLSYQYEGMEMSFDESGENKVAVTTETPSKESKQDDRSMSKSQSEETTPPPRKGKKKHRTTTPSPSNESRSRRAISSSEDEDRVHKKSRRKSAPVVSPEYEPNEDISRERSHNKSMPYQEDDDGDTSRPPNLPFSGFSLAHTEGDAKTCLVQQFKELITDIASDFEVPEMFVQKMTLENVRRAVQICRTMTFVELSKAVGTIMEIEVRDTRMLLTERKVLRDIILMCGTGPAFRMMKAWLEQRKIRGEAAAEIIAALPSYILSPSPSLIQQFYELIHSLSSFGDEQVKISSVLAFSHLLRVACVSKKAFAARFSDLGNPCHDNTASHYLTYFEGKMRSNVDSRRVYVAAIGNTGADAALPMLLSIARDSTKSPYIRASAILSMKYIVFRNPTNTMPILLRVYHNTGYPTAVRIAALSLLFYTIPPLTVWQRIAISTWYEPNVAIKSYVWSSLNNMATMDDPYYQEMTNRAIAVLSLARVVPLGPHRPYNLVRAAVSNRLHEVIMEQLSWSADLTAANIYYRQTQRLGGFSRLQMEGDIWLADADSFLTSLSEMLRISKHPGDSQKARPAIPELPRSTSKIRQALSIMTRELPKLEGHMAFRLGELHERMLPLDRKMVPFLEEAISRIETQMMKKSSSKPMMYQKMGESGFWLSAPSEIGFPIELTVSVPWGLRLKSELSFSFESGMLSADISAMYTSQLMAHLSVYTPFDCVAYVAGAYSQTMMQLPPFRLTSNWDHKALTSEVAFSSLSPHSRNVIFYQNSRPFTAQRDVLSQSPLSLSVTTRTVHVAPIMQSDLLPMSSPISLIYSSAAPDPRWAPEPHWVFSYPALWPGIEVATLKLEVSQPSPISMLIKLGRAKAEGGEVVINTQSDASPTVTPPTSPPTTQTTPTSSSTTPMPDTSTTQESSTVYVSTTDNPSSTTTEYFYTTTSSADINTTDEGTIMEEILNPNLSILSSDVEDPTGTFNASTLNLLSLGANSNRSNFLLRHVLSKMKSGQAYVLTMALKVNHSDIARYKVFSTYGVGRARLYYRMGVFLVDDIERWQVGLTATLKTPTVPLLRLKSILETNLTSNIFMDINYVDSSIQDLVSLQGTIQRTQSQASFARNHPSTVECLARSLDVQPECRRMAIEAGYLDQYNLTVTYNDHAKRYGPVMQHYFSLVKHSLFPYLTEEEEHGGTETSMIKVVSELSPDGHTAAMWVRSPYGESELSGMPMAPGLLQSLRVNPVLGFLPRFQDPSFCSMESDRMVTFDGSRYDYKIGDCWHVLTKDCSGRSKFAVLTRNISNRTEVEVNLDNHQIVRLMPGAEVIVNGRRVDLNDQQVAEAFDQAGTRLLELTSSSDQALTLRLPAHGLTLMHSNGTLLIRAKAGLRGRLCGMCGDFDGEIEADYRGPNGEVISNARKFAMSYALPLTSCHMPRFYGQ